MQRLLMATLVATMAMAAMGDAEAKNRKAGSGGETAAEDSYNTIQAEWLRARSVGGYPDPITAVIALFNGTLPASAIQPGLNDPNAPEVQNPKRFY